MKARVKVTGDLMKEVQAAIDKKKQLVLAHLILLLMLHTPKKTGYAASRWHIEGNRIVNDADYIDDLNKGSSQQAPAYFIEQTLLSQEGVRPSGTIVRSQ